LVFDKVTELNPARIVVDSLSELRLLAQSPLRYRRQILALKHFFASRNCTVVLTDDLSTLDTDLQLHSIVHGVVVLEQLVVAYGAERRRLHVMKMRGLHFRAGFHDFTIKKGGLEIYPRLTSSEHHKAFSDEFVPSGSAEMDSMLCGGFERGTSALFLGATGVGKSTLALTCVMAAADRGQTAVIFAFDEGQGTINARAQTIGLPLQQGLDKGFVQVRQIDPAEVSPGEFTHLVRHAVEVDGARVLVIDSLNGYINAMPEERFLILQMHELLSYLCQLGVFTILVLAQQSLQGPKHTAIDLSYLSDAIVLLRYFESDGTIRRGITAVKKRSGYHENAIREFRLTPQGVNIGPPLKGFRGVLVDIPDYAGPTQLFATGNENA
jgi:circadian clock protein KaiC